MNEMYLKNARTAYNTLIAMLDDKKMYYKRHDEDLFVTYGMQGDNLPMEFIVSIEVEKQLVRIISPLPGKFEGKKIVDGALACGRVNYMLDNGSFEMDCKKGKIQFRVTSSFLYSLISKDVFEYLVGASGYIVDEFNHKFFKLSKGEITLEEFFAK